MYRNNYRGYEPNFQIFMDEKMRAAEEAARREYDDIVRAAYNPQPKPTIQEPVSAPIILQTNSNKNNAMRVDITDFKELSKYPRHPDGDSIIFVNEEEKKFYIRQINLMTGNWELLEGTLVGEASANKESAEVPLPIPTEPSKLDTILDTILERLDTLSARVDKFESVKGVVKNAGNNKGNIGNGGKSQGNVGDDTASNTP